MKPDFVKIYQFIQARLLRHAILGWSHDAGVNKPLGKCNQSFIGSTGRNESDFPVGNIRLLLKSITPVLRRLSLLMRVMPIFFPLS